MDAVPASNASCHQDSWSDTASATLALARRSKAFMAKWALIDPKPATYQAKVPNQYPSKLRKLPVQQRHYALLDEQEYWMEVLADHFPPSWVDAAQVLHHLATIIPMSAPSITGPYRTIRQLLNKAADYSSRAGKDNAVNIRCPAIPLALLYALKINGSAQLGLGDMPHALAETIEEAHLQWLMQDPSEAVIPKCWQVWAINHQYPHAAYIGKPPAERQPEPRVPDRALSHMDDRLNMKGIPRRFSMPHRRSPQHESSRQSSPDLGYTRSHYAKDNNGMLIEDDDDFELWDASFHEEDELVAMPHDLKADMSLEEPPFQRIYRRASSLRSQSSIDTQQDHYRDQSLDADPLHLAETDDIGLVPLDNADQQANVFNIKTLEDMRHILADLRSQSPIRCPTASELLPFADNDVHEAFGTYTRYIGAKIKAAMKLTLGQILLASPLAKVVKQIETIGRTLESCRREAELARQQLPRAIDAVKEEHHRDVVRLQSEISQLKGTIERRDRKARAETNQVPFQITTRAAARAEKVSVVRQTRSKTQPTSAPGLVSKHDQTRHTTTGSRKRGLSEQDSGITRPSKRQSTKRISTLNNVYASYFDDDD